MARRRKLKKVSLAQTAVDESPLDLRPNTILNPKADVIGIEVDNPNKPEEKVIVWRSRRDPLFALYAQGLIDDPQRLAGEHWRECYRLCEIGGVRGQDMTREYVDSSPAIQYEPISDMAVRAAKDIKKADGEMGALQQWIVRRILGDGLFPNQLAELLGVSTHWRSVGYYCGQFRDALQKLAIAFTYCS